MDFAPTEAQRDLAGLTSDIARSLVGVDRQRELDEAENRFDDALWRELARAGVLSAALDERAGGDGLGLLEQTGILTELGRVLAAVPYVSCITMAAGAIARFGTDAQVDEWARPAGAGSALLTTAFDEELVAAPAHPSTTATPEGDAWVLSGTKVLVDAAPVADLFVVSASTPSGVAVFLVRADDPGVEVTRQVTTDFSAVGEVTLRDVRLAADRVLGDDGAEVLDWTVRRGAVGVCAYQYGVLDEALKVTSEYARERVQFGRPIGSFQAVGQRLADAYIDVKAVRLTLTQAAWRLAEELPDEGAVSTAKFWTADAGHRVAHTVIHVHGGVGLDTTHPVHRYFLAAKQAEFRLGSGTDHLRRLGETLASVPA
ncbi:acyl-CoA dehydrogenase family protein [Rhodococcus sp. HNM0569]|uniref:acyl-CoA dehydrogenase family protein n=1 Tax=Rhodococcus sp. HNM0569 TaxID=2716340 RepID=UPI001469F92C|nr:acyl-CoA dehydrogenase family protein [Rhodococcus sp. HNM0569]NLU82257.1 acyl-CoA/acyl-ACP dehydrogenase [Rhodococcus sp. HNM0569]